MSNVDNETLDDHSRGLGEDCQFHSENFRWSLSLIDTAATQIFQAQATHTKSMPRKTTRPRRRSQRKLFLRIRKLNISLRKTKNARKKDEWIPPVNVNGSRSENKTKEIQMNWIYRRFVPSLSFSLTTLCILWMARKNAWRWGEKELKEIVSFYVTNRGGSV